MTVGKHLGKSTSLALAIMLVGTMSAGVLSTHLFVGVVSAANGNFSGGDGSVGNPYVIVDVYDLQNMRSNLSAWYVLGRDIDASITRTWNGGAGFEPIGNLTDPFIGGFDGDGYNITGLYINRPTEDYVGLFGHLGYGGTIHDFTLQNVNITGRDFTGGAIGQSSKNNITQSVALPDSPVAYWKMNESQWTGTAGEVVDSSGNGNDGTALNGANTTTGKYDRAGNFDGVDDYVETNKTATDLGINGANPRTIMFWVYTRSFNDGGVYECGAYTTNQDFSFRTLTTDNNWRVQLITNDIDFTYQSLNTWVHFTIVYDGTYVIVYADGTEITRVARTLNTAGTNTFRMGKWDTAHFDGLIDEMVIYNRALSGREIARSYFFHSIDGIYNINGNGSISGRDYTGGLIGSMNLGIVASHSGFSGTVVGDRYVGGIAGMSGSTIDHCTFSGNATAAYMDVGGIAGFNSADITDSLADGNVTGSQENAGGIAGGNNGTITSCSFTGSVKASGYDTGGVVGENHGGTVDSCQAQAAVDSPYRTGGLIGTSWGGGIVRDSHAVGNVSGVDMIGGLIGRSQDSTVDNTYADSTVTGTGSMVGGLVGLQERGDTTNSHSKGTVQGGVRTGGLIGYLLQGNATLSYSEATVTGGDATGGIVGRAISSQIQSSVFRANVSGHDYVGGVVGMMEMLSSVSDSKSNVGTVSGNNHTGGIAGYSSSSEIVRCYSGDDVSGSVYVGGLAGYMLSSYVNDSYSMNYVSGNNITGGLVGESDSSEMLRCYRSRPLDTHGLYGALIGLNNGSIFSSFVDNETLAGCPYVGSGNTSGVLNRSTTDLLNSATYTGGWDFSSVWWADSNMVRPFLRSEFSTDIYDDHELQLLRFSAVSFTVHRDIYISGDKNWSMWGNVGSFLKIPSANRVDGGGYYIHNLRMTGMEGVGGSPTDNYAFIGQAYSDVVDLHIVNASIHVPNSGTYSVKYVGGLVGYMDSGYIIQCSFEGNISRDPVSTFEDFMTGGLVGGVRSYFPHTVNIYDSMFRGSIDGPGHVGGLTGIFHPDDWVEVTIENSYVIGDIRQNSNIWPTNTGGLIGVIVPGRSITATISNCYFVGTLETVSGYTSPIVSTQDRLEMLPLVTYTYYNTSSKFDVYNGYPLTQEEMTHASSFPAWDFSTHWRIQEGHTYPYLAWERNSPVEITSPDSLPDATQDSYYSTTINASDGDPTDVRPLWTLRTNASWLSITENGTLYGTPGLYDVGTFWVNVTADDMRGSEDWRNLTVTVLNVNDDPVITTNDITATTQGAAYAVTYTADDADGDALTWSLSTNAAWLSLNDSTIEGIPTNSDVGTYWVNITVSDGNRGTDHHNFTLAVLNINDPPVIENFTVPDGVLDMVYSLLITATDPDGDSLTWSMTGPQWLSINAGLIIGTPTESGNFSVNVAVSDGNGGTDSVSFTIHITADSDGDGVNNTDDAYPLDPTRWAPPVEYHNNTVYKNKTVYRNETVWAPIEDVYLKDTDGDGMPDSWELLYGLNPNSSADASGDEDGDGITNLQEFLGGSSPTYPNNGSSGSNIRESEESSSTVLPAFIALLLGMALGAFVMVLKRGYRNAEERKDIEYEKETILELGEEGANAEELYEEEIGSEEDIVDEE